MSRAYANQVNLAFESMQLQIAILENALVYERSNNNTIINLLKREHEIEMLELVKKREENSTTKNIKSHIDEAVFNLRVEIKEQLTSVVKEIIAQLKNRIGRSSEDYVKLEGDDSRE